MVSRWLVHGEKESSQVDFFSAQRQRNLAPSCVDEVPWSVLNVIAFRALAVNAKKQNNLVQVVERWQIWQFIQNFWISRDQQSKWIMLNDRAFRPSLLCPSGRRTWCHVGMGLDGFVSNFHHFPFQTFHFVRGFIPHVDIYIIYNYIYIWTHTHTPNIIVLLIELTHTTSPIIMYHISFFLYTSMNLHRYLT